MDTSRVKKLLREYGIHMEINQNRIMELYKQMQKSDSVIDSIGQISRSFIDVSKGQKKEDISDLMLRHEEIEKQKTLDIRRELSKLIEEQESLNRIWICLQALHSQEYQIIHELYIENAPYKKVLSDFGHSEKLFLKIINQGLSKVVDLYNSSYSNKEIGEIINK